MKSSIFALLVSALLVLPLAAETARDKTELAKLEGTWQLVSAETNGKKLLEVKGKLIQAGEEVSPSALDERSSARAKKKGHHNGVAHSPRVARPLTERGYQIRSRAARDFHSGTFFSA
jgi:hypothetical protein